MRTALAIGLATLICALVAAARTNPRQADERETGSETVFDRAPAEIFSTLDGAAATGENGRVGSENASLQVGLVSCG
jgi:hypothetical protein